MQRAAKDRRRIENVTRGVVLATQCRVANTFFSRFRGLMGVAALRPGEGLLLIPSQSIHTHFMRFPIDALYLDASWRIVAIEEGMRPWRLGRYHRQAHSVLELPAGVVRASGSQVGDVLRVHPPLEA